MYQKAMQQDSRIPLKLLTELWPSVPKPNEHPKKTQNRDTHMLYD